MNVSSSLNKMVRKQGDVNLKKVLKELKGLGVSVGIHRAEGEVEGTTIALIGTVNEYGSTDGHTPERSFMRSTYRENIKTYKGDIKKIIQSVIAGKYTAKVGMGRLGKKAELDIKNKIASNIQPENAQSTKDQKDSTSTLIDDGQLIASIRWEFTDPHQR